MLSIIGFYLGFGLARLIKWYKIYKISKMPHGEFAAKYQKKYPIDAIESSSSVGFCSKKELHKYFKDLPGR